MGFLSFFKKRNKRDKLEPESRWVVAIDNYKIKVVDYDGIDTSLALDQINQIVIETNDSGPIGADLWWIIKSEQENLLIPNGATGESEMIEYFQMLPNFDNAELIKAMRSTENATFICWKG